ncbi:putative ribonuclease H-like domain-containing protein [Tanacetum coccineum]|uniref:Ribonuclease H-like domain-containing protein n=1 Tax=Tanacetum coccineum TaxID=301880 RepID=A0ABQ5FEI3_9ASTR
MPNLEDDSNVFPNDSLFSGAYNDEDVGVEADFNNMDNTIDVSPIPTLRVQKDHPKEEPKTISQALKDENWVEAMQEELLQFKLQKVWILVDLPYGKKAIGTKWVFRNKRDERSIVVKNKARLIAQGFRKEEGIDYDEVFAPVVRIEAIRLFLALASFMGFSWDLSGLSEFQWKGIEQGMGKVRAPRQNGVYNLDLKNIVPSRVPHHALEGEGSDQPTEPQPTLFPTQPSTGDQPPETSSSNATTQDSRDSLEGTNRNEGDQVQIPHDSPFSGGHTSARAEGALNLQELFVLCTNLSKRVLALEFIKDAQAAEISALKSRNKKLEKKCKPSISHHRAWLKSVSMKKRFGKKEFVSKQGRKKSKPESTLDDSTVFDDQDADHGMEYMETEEVVDEGRQSDGTKEVKLTDDTEVVKDNGSGNKGGNAEELVSNARPEVSIARPDIDAARQEDSAAKEKGVSIKDVQDSSRPARSILTLKPFPTIDPKDKGKSVLEEPEPAKKMTRKVEKERQREEEASKAAIAEMYDEVQAGIDADALFAAKLQQEEREEYTIEERAKFLAETIAAQRKFRAAQRSAEIRSRPPTKSQLRNLMMTYLKNMGGYKHSQLKAKSFEEIKGMYERQKKSVQDFVPIGSAKEEELIKKMNEKATGEDTSNKEKVLEEPDSTKVEVKQEGHEDSTKKRPGKILKMKDTKKSKRQKTDSDLEEEEQLKAFLMIVFIQCFIIVALDLSKVTNPLQAKGSRSIHAPTLALLEGMENFVVYYDASHKGLGSILMQKEKAIAYASLNSRYDVPRLEAIVLVAKHEARHRHLYQQVLDVFESEC